MPLSSQSEKIAVVLFNLGAPDRPESVKPFLINLFSDKAILPLAQPWRWLLGRYIALRRASSAAQNYQAIGGRSPLLDNTRLQAQAIELALNKSGNRYKCFIAMRYWHPMSEECAREVASWNPDRVVLLPLYPQFSTTTTLSSILAWKTAAKNTGLDAQPHHTLCCWPAMKGYVHSAAEQIQATIKKVKSKPWFVLFSAHGIPKDFIKRFGDPYEAHVKQSAQAMATAAGLKPSQWSIAYQSRVGGAEWLQPYCDARIEELARKRKHIIVYPISFVSEHSETLVELDMEYRDLAMMAQASGYSRVPTVDTAKDFVQGLVSLITQSVAGKPDAYVRHCEHGAFACPRFSRFYVLSQKPQL